MSDVPQEKSVVEKLEERVKALESIVDSNVTFYKKSLEDKFQTAVSWTHALSRSAVWITLTAFLLKLYHYLPSLFGG